MVVMDSDLDRLYRDPGQVSSLGGIDRLYNAAKKSIPSLTRDQVIQYLQTQDSYTKQKQIKRKFKRRKTVAVDVNDLYQADLCDMQKFAEFNDNFKYFLSCIDVFSKMGFTVPLKSKKPLEIVNALSSIFRSYGIPLKINFDNGGEFKNATVKAFLKECRVIHYFTRNDDIKCSVVERFNRTIKERLWAYMTQENGYRYIDVLPSVTESYNSSVHSATNFAPVSVGLEESRIIRKQLLADQSISTSHQKFAVDDYVRISVKKGAFEHGFEDSFSSEIFIVTDIINSSGIYLYRIKDRSNEPVSGLFYSEELSKVIIDDSKGYRIEKVLRTRRRNGVEEYLIRWAGYSSAYDSWEPKNNLK